MALVPGDEIVEIGDDWLASDEEWSMIADHIIDEVINDWLQDMDEGEYF